MTPEEFYDAVASILQGQYAGDYEMTHSETDELMETVLRELGYGHGIDLIEDSERWYA